jgi:ATP-dependent Clp protease adaptor protein ClpS
MQIPTTLQGVVKSALARASAAHHPKATVFHLLSALLEEPETCEIVQKAGGSVSRLQSVLASQLETVSQPSAGDRLKSVLFWRYGAPVEPAFHHSIVGAILHLKSSRRDPRPPDVLAALFRSGDRRITELLSASGLTRLGVVRNICGRNEVDLDGISNSPMGAAYEVVILNDDYTEMQLVVDILKTVFKLNSMSAFRTMMKIHKDGRAVLGPYPAPVAADLTARATQMAEAAEAPLLVRLRAAGAELADAKEA